MESTKHPIKLYHSESKKISQHELIVTRSLHPSNGNILWSIQLDFFGKPLNVDNEYFLSEAIDTIRQIIEPLSYRMLIKWCELDAFQTGLIADMSAGQSFYKYEIMKKAKKRLFRKNRPNTATFHVLDEAAPEDVVSLEEQKKYRDGF